MEATLSALPHPAFFLSESRVLEFLNAAGKNLLDEYGLTGTGRMPAPLGEWIERAIEDGRVDTPCRLTDSLSFEIMGRKRYFNPCILLLRLKDGEIFGVAVILEDVTSWRLLDDMKTDFVTTVSHELRTPLTGIRMALHLLVERCHSSSFGEDEAELLRTAYGDTERLNHTLDNLLDLTRAEESGDTLQLRHWEPREMLSRIIAKAVAAFPGDAAGIDLDLDEGLPVLRLDPERIEHVFLNLLSNALKYSDPGGRVRVRGVNSSNGMVRFSIIDDGPGIPPEDHERVFQRFYRAPGQEHNGAGLGLSIAVKLTELHGGRVGVRSEPGAGSEFYVDLPRVNTHRVNRMEPFRSNLER